MLPKFGFRTRTTAFWPMGQSSIMSVKFDCPVARQNFSLFATAHDCETDLWDSLHKIASDPNQWRCQRGEYMKFKRFDWLRTVCSLIWQCNNLLICFIQIFTHTAPGKGNLILCFTLTIWTEFPSTFTYSTPNISHCWPKCVFIPLIFPKCHVWII